MRKTTTRIPLIAIVTFAAAAAASCVRVEADVPEAEVTQKAVSFEGINRVNQVDEVSTTQTFTLSADDLSWAENLNAEVYAKEIELRAIGKFQDLSFIHYARVTMSDGTADSTTPAVEIINYERPADTTAIPVIDVKTSVPIDVTKVWSAKKVVITMEIAGTLPQESWAADVTLHLSGKITYKM
jgi:hypothetical protein